MTDKLRAAAQALIDRWDTPNWKDARHTGEYINALRAALADDQLRDATEMIGELVAYRATSTTGDTAHFGVESAARAWARGGTVEAVPLRHLRIVPMHSECGPECRQCGMLCKRGRDIDERFSGRLAIALECMTFDPIRFWESSTQLLSEYKAEWEKVNPSPPTFMGEPVPPERRERLMKAKADRAEAAQKSRADHEEGDHE